MRDSQKNRNIHQEALVNFDRIQSALYEERRQCLEDRRFYSISGAQWEGDLGDQFENKPKFEVNKVHLAVIKIINEYRNNRVTVDFVSKDGKPDNDLSDVCNGLFRADEQDSSAEEAYDNSFEEAVGGGFGAFRLTTEYEDEEDDENECQRIKIEPIYDADNSVFFDLDAKKQDKSDAKYAYVMYSMSPEDFEEEFGKEAPSSLNKTIEYAEYDWCSPDMVYVAEYYRVEMKKETIRIFENLVGEEERYSEEDFEDDPELERKLAATGSSEIRQKKIRRRKIRKYILSGNEILEDCGYVAGKYIPIIPVYGKRWFVDDIERCMGHVRLVKDSQRLKNMLMSKLAEISSLSTVEKPIFTPEQVSGHEVMWAEDNIKNYPYQLLNPITDISGSQVPTGPIGYTKPPQIPPALAALLQLVDIDMKELLGGSGEAEKMLSHVSGKAHEMIQKRIDGQAFIYMSNFSKGIKRTGEVWLSMAKDIYVEKGRNMKTIDPMNQIGTVELLEPGYGEEGTTDKNDLTKASFDVAVDVGPSSASQRESTVNTLVGVLSITQDQEISQVLQSMIMMNMEGEGMSQTREFFRKKLVQMGVYPPTAEEAEQMAAAAQNKELTPEQKAYEAMAEEANAKAVKTRTEVLETMADVEKTKAQTAEIYSSMDLNQLKAAQEMISQVQEQKQANIPTAPMQRQGNIPAQAPTQANNVPINLNMNKNNLQMQ